MDHKPKRTSPDPGKRDRDVSPITDLEVERLQKKRKSVIPPYSPVEDSSQWSTNDASSNSQSSQQSKHEEEIDCFSVLVCATESSIQESLELSPKKLDIFIVTRVDFEPSETSKPVPDSYSPMDFIPPPLRRDLSSCPLYLFSQYGKLMKHEDFVIKIFRGYVKGMQWIISHKKEWPSKGVFAVLPDNDAALVTITPWEEFKAQVLLYKESIKDLIAPENLPATDKNRKHVTTRRFLSYSKFFIAYFFQQNGYLIYLYHLYCKVVFEASPKVLCKAWRMDCGKKKAHRHGKGCKKRWNDLKFYAQRKMLEELGISPYED